jgi:hypothetical protein
MFKGTLAVRSELECPNWCSGAYIERVAGLYCYNIRGSRTEAVKLSSRAILSPEGINDYGAVATKYLGKLSFNGSVVRGARRPSATFARY